MVQIIFVVIDPTFHFFAAIVSTETCLRKRVGRTPEEILTTCQNVFANLQGIYDGIVPRKGLFLTG